MSSGAPTPAAAGSDDAVAAFAAASAFAAAAMAALPRGLEGKRAAGSSCAAASLALRPRGGPRSVERGGQRRVVAARRPSRPAAALVRAVGVQRLRAGETKKCGKEKEERRRR